QRLDEPGEAGQLVHDGHIAALEKCAPLGRHRLGILEVLVEKQPGVAGVQTVDVLHHQSECSVSTATIMPATQHDVATMTAMPASFVKRPRAMPAATSEMTIAGTPRRIGL